ncbi:MAG: hypothetical protein ACJ8J0_18445 [Longimicrobiaceae bacterium]
MSATLPATGPASDAPPARRPGDVPPNDHGVGWRGLLREFAVIVAGVLCALAAQAWWDAHQERGREHDYLRQLLADTRENERRLDEGIRTDSTAGSYAARVVDALTSSTPPPPADSIAEWIIQAGVGSNVQALAGNYRALVGTGDLRLVRNDSLRALLASYASSLENEGERQLQFSQVVSAQAASMAQALPFIRRVFVGGIRTEGMDVARMRAAPEVGGVLFSIQAANANRVSGLRSLRNETRRVRRALEAELGPAAAPPADPAGG